MCEHITDLVPVYVRGRRGGPFKASKAVCSCDWEGPVRGNLELAYNDAAGHEADAFVASLARPLRTV